MKVTVCQLPDERAHFATEFEHLAAHVRRERSSLVLLPELPFSEWFMRERASSSAASERVWQEAVAAHSQWMSRLGELAPAVVLATRPVTETEAHGRVAGSLVGRFNEAFIQDTAKAALISQQPPHRKRYLPDEPGFWEASWYQRGIDLEAGSGTAEPPCVLTDVKTASLSDPSLPGEPEQVRVGFLICTELWFFHHARAYGKQGAHVIANPRATGESTLEKWLVGGRAAAVVSGAFVLSSNRVNVDGVNGGHGASQMGGQGWIIGPDGQLCGHTTASQPFLTVEIDLRLAQDAKSSYPRYVVG